MVGVWYSLSQMGWFGDLITWFENLAEKAFTALLWIGGIFVAAMLLFVIFQGVIGSRLAQSEAVQNAFGTAVKTAGGAVATLATGGAAAGPLLASTFGPQALGALKSAAGGAV